MARKVIILSATFPAAGQRIVSAAFWLVPLASRQPYYARPNFVSQVKDVTTPETAALVAGQVVEQVMSGMQFPASSFPTLASIEAELVTGYNALQAALAADDQYQRAGSFWDGTTWTITNNIT